MRNWDYDITTLKDDKTAIRWRLERMITYGLGGDKLKEAELREHLPHLNIPDDRRAFLTLLLS